jgi:hypothetical protein
MTGVMIRYNKTLQREHGDLIARKVQHHLAKANRMMKASQYEEARHFF